MPDFSRESSDVAIRFHRAADWYVVSHTDEWLTLRVHANSERIVELFLRLTVYLDDIVNVVIRHPRDNTSWRATTRFLPDVREALGRLRWPLASFGGAELSLMSDDDQITLTPLLELIIYTQDERWRARLETEGIVSREFAPRPLFDPLAVPSSPAPELTRALAAAVERLAMDALP